MFQCVVHFVQLNQTYLTSTRHVQFMYLTISSKFSNQSCTFLRAVLFITCVNKYMKRGTFKFLPNLAIQFYHWVKFHLEREMSCCFLHELTTVTCALMVRAVNE